ncbi:PQQ-dependent sugar dehydrogenase [Vreelandella populi]|uniref:PQQ-dependent sugar dehydrogenase n=1 Tax=Vreelandella populi TaxID=2498858 RepID=UPI0021AFEFA5|nr:PQQ-dependent sugar dehydrogenase [Halomonas populi]
MYKQRRGVTPLRLTRAVCAAMLFGTAGTAYADVSVSEDIIENGYESEEVNLNIVQVVSGLEHPWAVAWLPDGRMLVTERPGRIHLIDGDEVVTLGNLPTIASSNNDETPVEGGGQGGLLDVAVHPDYDENGWIYFTFSSPGDPRAFSTYEPDYGTGLAVGRARIDTDNGELADVETLYTQVPRTHPGAHYGSRIVFPGNGEIIFPIGDRNAQNLPQDLTNPGGKMIRLLEDGGAHPDNPFIGMTPGNLRPEIFSYGHRNNQGLALHPETGELWAIDHGPNGGDLLYRVEAGNNHGWPMIAFGTEYTTEAHIGLGTEAPGVTAPVHVWEENMAPSGMAFYTADGVAEWQNSLFVGSLKLEQLHRLVLDGDNVTHEEILLSDTLGRIRDVRQGPDGMLYIVTDEEDGGVYRLEPEDA